ncbi:MAG: 30S ribosomal protein S17 [Candidatus Pacebacteria bacterium]|nr:30S ribosomal protein S17 [Candidatus Paceibacterota bacterium]
MPKRTLTGLIVSDKMDKTVVVRVESIKEHPVYKRKYKSHQKYKAHDELNQYKAGEKVIIEESAPLSHDKRWKVIGKAA